MIQPPRILFFVNDCVPSEEQLLEAQGYGSKVSFRNAQFVPAPVYKKIKGKGEKMEKVLLNANSLEKCDGVAGDVPDLYEGYPLAEDVMEEYDSQRKALLAEAKKKAEAKASSQKDLLKAEKAAEAKAKKEAEKVKKEAEETPKKPADWKPN